MKNFGTGFAVLFVLAVAGCATPYQPYGMGGGYGQYKVNDSAYVVTFSGNGYASRERVYYFWLYRCAQLTKARGYELFVIGSAGHPAVMAENRGAALPAVYLSGSPGRLIRVRGTAPALIYMPGPRLQTYSYTGTVYMFHAPLAPAMSWGFDADKVLAELQPYVRSNGNAPVPLPVAVLVRAFVGHATVQVGEGLKLGVSPPGAVPAAAGLTALKPRSAVDVQETMDGSMMVLVYKAYEDYARDKLIDVAGSIHLAFDIAPGGAISNCHIVSSTYPDGTFRDSIVEDAEEVTFQASKVATTRVADFPITFAPLP